MKNFAPRVEILGIAETGKAVLIITATIANTAMESAFVNIISNWHRNECALIERAIRSCGLKKEAQIASRKGNRSEETSRRRL